MRRLLGGAVLAVGLGAAAIARADDPPVPVPVPAPDPDRSGPTPPPEPKPAPIDNRARAQELFDSALADAEAGNFAAACPKFLASQESDPKTSTLLNLGSCYEKNGQTASAWGAFRDAETLARKTARADWESAARARAEALEPRLLRVAIDVPRPNRIPSLVVTRDGSKTPSGEWGVPIPVDPGSHVIRASAEGHQPWEARVELAAGATGSAKTVRVRIPLLDPLEARFRPSQPLPDQEPDAAASPPSSWWTPLRTAGVATGVTGAAGVLTSLVLGLIAKGNYDDARAACASGARGCAPGSSSRADDAYGLASAATVVFIVGAAAFVTGGSLVLFAPAPAAPSQATTPGPVGVRF